MQGKITLITPPDIFENDSKSVLFINLNEKDQETVSKWFSNANIDEDINIYFYDSLLDVEWLMYSVARCEYSFINLNNLTNVEILAGYILGKKSVFYRIDNENTAAFCHYINQNRITNIEKFLERVFNGKI